MPLCSRCTGLYLGFVFSLIVLLALERKIKTGLPKRKIITALIVLFCLMAVDSVLTFFKAVTVSNAARFATGFSVGWFLILVLLPIKNSVIFCRKILYKESYLDKKINFVIWLAAAILISLAFILTYKKALFVWNILSFFGLVVFFSFIVYILLFALNRKLANSICTTTRYIIFFFISFSISTGFISLSAILKSLIHPYFRF